jgi:hypothetical protein
VNTVLVTDSINTSTNAAAPTAEVISIHGLTMLGGCFSELSLPNRMEEILYPQETMGHEVPVSNTVNESIIFSAAMESKGLCISEGALDSFVPVFQLG